MLISGRDTKTLATFYILLPVYFVLAASRLEIEPLDHESDALPFHRRSGRLTCSQYIPELLLLLKLAYLDIFVDAPRRRFPVVNGLYGCLGHSSQVASTEQPRNAGLHRLSIHAWKTIVVQLQWI